MAKIVVIFISGLCFGQVNWTYEIVDSVMEATYDFYFNSLALDSAGIPHIVYNKHKADFISYKVVYASRAISNWQKEVIESGPYLYYYGFSLVFDTENIPHFSYYRRDNAVGKTYVCHARRESTGWVNGVVDSCTGNLGNYFWDFYSSISIDTTGLPGIAYIAWNVEDSLHYIKYAHYNGANWDTFIVDRDTTWHHRYPLDWSPSLKFDRESIPHIAFYRVRSDTHGDTIMIGYFDNTLNTWIISPAVCDPYGGCPISLALNSHDHPCIAHGWGAAVAYSWWDGLSWHTEGTGASMGWVGVKIVLDLDSLDNPHILYRMDFSPVDYCYKRDDTWYIHNWVGNSDGHISLSLDNSGRPHVCYNSIGWDSIGHVNFTSIIYAEGIYTGTEEKNSIEDPRIPELAICPNPFNQTTEIRYLIADASKANLKIYNVSGRLIKQFDHKATRYSNQVSWDGADDTGNRVPAGVYFIQLDTEDHCETEKVILLR